MSNSEKPQLKFDPAKLTDQVSINLSGLSFEERVELRHCLGRLARNEERPKNEIEKIQVILCP